MPLPCLTLHAPYVSFGVHRTPPEGQELTFAPFLLLAPPGEAQLIFCRELLWLKWWKWSQESSLLSINSVSYGRGRQLRWALERHSARCAHSRAPCLSFGLFLKRNKEEERKKKGKYAGRTGGKGKLDTSVFPLLLNKLLGRIPTQPHHEHRKHLP